MEFFSVLVHIHKYHSSLSLSLTPFASHKSRRVSQNNACIVCFLPHFTPTLHNTLILTHTCPKHTFV